jgi:hypothetical protein
VCNWPKKVERRSVDHGRGNVDTKKRFYTTSSYESGKSLATSLVFCINCCCQCKNQHWKIKRHSVDNGGGKVNTKERFYTTSSYESGKSLTTTFIFVSIVVVVVKINTEWSKDVPLIMEEGKMVQKNAQKMLGISTKL